MNILQGHVISLIKMLDVKQLEALKEYIYNLIDIDLGQIAMMYRNASSNKNEALKSIAISAYARAVDKLIATGNWVESPSPEDQLPYVDMPQVYFDYWNWKL